MGIRTPNNVKSIAMTTKVKIQARPATAAPRSEPTTPAPMERQKAMKARAHAMGWRIIAYVRPSADADAALLKPVPSIWRIMTAGL